MCNEAMKKRKHNEIEKVILLSASFYYHIVDVESLQALQWKVVT